MVRMGRVEQGRGRAGGDDSGADGREWEVR